MGDSLNRRFPGLLCLSGLFLAGCSFTPGIGVSNTSLAFDRNERPMFVDVWNTNAQIPALTIVASPSAPWILVDPQTFSSDAPLPGAVADKVAVRVAIDRARLSKGTHSGRIRFSGPGVRPVNVDVSVIQDRDNSGGLSLLAVQPLYGRPYLMEFSFAVHDKDGQTVNAEPSQFSVLAWEDGQPVDAAVNGLRLQRMASRQLRTELVLDYSAAMQSVPGAIAAMEDAASNVFLPALNEDALAAVSEFHRDDHNSEVVAVPGVNRDYTRARIAAIQSEYVRNFQSGARVHDAIDTAVRRFGPADPAREDRYVVVFADGRDTSSLTTPDAVVALALMARVTVYAVGFGPGVADSPLADIADRTGGALFVAATVGDLGAAFQRIVEELQSRYVLRWATLRRDNREFYPSFSVAIGGAAGAHTALSAYNAGAHSGDVLQGRLRLVSSDSQDKTTLFLRADYVPRNVTRFKLWLQTNQPFNAWLVESADDGLCGGWQLTYQESGAGRWLEFWNADSTPLPFAAFGPLLRIEFNGISDDPVTGVYIDNSVYVNGQTFAVDDVPAVVPPSR